MDSIPPLKKCSKCKQEFPATTEFFRKSNKVKCGIYSQCKTCTREADRNNPRKDIARVKHYKKNADRIKEKARIKGREARLNPEKHDEIIKREKQRRKENPEVYRQYSRDFRKKNPEKVNEYNRNYYARHLETSRISSRIRAHRRRGVKQYQHSTHDILNLYKQQRGCCWWCGNELLGKFEIDHRIPISRGGMDRLNNLVLTCRFCNRSKHNRLSWEWNGRLL